MLPPFARMNQIKKQAKPRPTHLGLPRSQWTDEMLRKAGATHLKEQPSLKEALEERQASQGKGKVPVEEVPVEEVPVEKVPVEEVPVEKVPVEEVPVEEVPAEEVPVEKVPVEEVPVEKVPAEEVPVEEVPVEKVPVEEVPVEKVPVEKVPVEKTDYTLMKRGKLNKMALKLGIKDPSKLPNKDAVIKAIKEAN